MSSAKVIKMREKRKSPRPPRFAVAAMCVGCFFRWMGTVSVTARIFRLQCPKCGTFDSFVSFLQDEYLVRRHEWSAFVGQTSDDEKPEPPSAA